MGRDTHDSRPTHQLATESYAADPLPDYEVFSAVVRVTADTLDAEVDG